MAQPDYHSNPKFEAFAAREPYFVVLTDPKFLRATLTAGDEREFFASGEHLVSWMFDIIHAGLSPQFAPVSTLEYGCGLGRLALPLARRPGSVTAVDRSPVMLDLARREAGRRNLGHIVFLTPPELFSTPRKFDLVICYHVLQRLRPSDGIELLRRLIGLISPDGIGVFQWPFLTRASGLVAASRWLRERVPGANALANALRGKPTGDPFVPTHTYSLNQMLAPLETAGFRSTHLVFEHAQEPAYAIVLAQKPERPARAAPVRQSTSASGLDADRATGSAPAVSDAEIDAFNRAAETYFSSLTDWEHHLAKPFSQPDEAPALLVNAATVLQALRLTPGMRVLDFGAGTGWLSRVFTQMGCHAVLVDVSPTALQIARELYRRQPTAGSQPAPEFLQYDGRRIALPDASLDRTVCFDAFHHAPDPDAVIREFGRLLKPGGRAVFAEPGPRHSHAPRSQFEARTYGVVENDIDVHAIWRVARNAGFADLKLCVFHEPPHFVSLEEYEDLIVGGPEQERWLASTRLFLRNVRNFFLVKAGAERIDSRATSGLGCEIRATLVTTPVIEGRPVVVDASVTNTGRAVWLASDARYGGVSLGAHIYSADGALLRLDMHREPLSDPPREIAPGETVKCRVTLPPQPAARYVVEFDCVASGVTWFAQAGSRPATVVIESLIANH
jgi:SAM-dependent methyltransferase